MTGSESDVDHFHYCGYKNKMRRNSMTVIDLVREKLDSTSVAANSAAATLDVSGKESDQLEQDEQDENAKDNLSECRG